MVSTLLDSRWFALIYLIILLFFVTGGILLSLKFNLLRETTGRSSPLFAPILSFFSLLLAFSLSSSAVSNKERASLIHQHADAIFDLNNMSLLFNDSIKSRVKQYTIHCIELKLEASRLHGAARSAIDVKSFWLNEKFLRWMLVMGKSSLVFHSEANLVADNVNKIMALDNKLHYSNQDRTPVVVMLLLLLCSWIIGFLLGLGYNIFRNLYYLGPLIFISLTSLTVLAIQDMDNPYSGIIKPPYDTYANMLRNINDE